MPKETQTQKTVHRSVTVSSYTCALCPETFGTFDACAKHEWNAHLSKDSETHTEYAYEQEVEFRYFASEASFDAFAIMECGPGHRFEGVGWYRLYEYEDRCMGCDMGTATGLKLISPDDTRDWITSAVEEVAESYEGRWNLDFALAADCPPTYTDEDLDSKMRRCSVYVKELSVSIVYGREDDRPAPTPEQVLALWKVWKHRNY